MADPKPLTRKELAEFLPNHRAIRAFEELFKQVPAEFVSQNTLIDEVRLEANAADSTAKQALGELKRIADAIELVSLSALPTFAQADDIDVNSPVVHTQDIINPSVLMYDRDVPYGELYATNASITVTVGAINTAYEITTGMTAGLTNLTEFGGDHYIKVSRSGMYLINWSISMDTAVGSEEIESGYMINGTAQSNGTAHTTVPAGNKGSNTASTALAMLDPLDEVSLFVRNHDAAHDIVVEHAALTLVRVLS